MWLIEQHPATVFGLWLLAGGVGWWTLDRVERPWIVGIAALGLLGVAVALAAAFFVPVKVQIPLLAIGGMMALASFCGMTASALIGLARRILAPTDVRQGRLKEHPDDSAP